MKSEYRIIANILFHVRSNPATNPQLRSHTSANFLRKLEPKLGSLVEAGIMTKTFENDKWYYGLTAEGHKLLKMLSPLLIKEKRALL